MTERRDGTERRARWREVIATKRFVVILFVLVGAFNSSLWYKSEYDSCVRNREIRATYNDAFETQRKFLAAARDARRAAANGEGDANSKAADTYQDLIDGQKSVRELDCGFPLPDNS